MKSILVTSAVINAICLATLILFVGIQVSSFGIWFYRWQFSVNNTYAQVNMQSEDLHAVTRHLIDYMQGHEPVLQITTIVGGEERPFFSEIEIRHMVDVYDLFVIGFWLQRIVIVLLVLSSAYFLKFGRNQLHYLFKAWQMVSGTILALFAGLTVLIAINWHHAFQVFHEIFFDNDYWILNPHEDLLINIVPYAFFITLSIFIGIFFAVGLLIMFVTGTMGKKHEASRMNIC